MRGEVSSGETEHLWLEALSLPRNSPQLVARAQIAKSQADSGQAEGGGSGTRTGDVLDFRHRQSFPQRVYKLVDGWRQAGNHVEQDDSARIRRRDRGDVRSIERVGAMSAVSALRGDHHVVGTR